MATLGSAGSTYLIALLGNMGLQLSKDKTLKGDDLIDKTGNSSHFYDDLIGSMRDFEEKVKDYPADYKKVKEIVNKNKDFSLHVINCFVSAKIDGGINMSQDDVDFFVGWCRAVLEKRIEFNSEIRGKDTTVKTMKELCERFGYSYEYLIQHKTYPWFYLSIILQMIQEEVPVVGMIKQPNSEADGTFVEEYDSIPNKTLSFFYPIEDITDTVTYRIEDFLFPDGSAVRPDHTTGTTLTLPKPKSGSSSVFESSLNVTIERNKVKVKLDNPNSYPKSAFTFFSDVVYGATIHNKEEMTTEFLGQVPDANYGNNDLTQVDSYILYDDYVVDKYIDRYRAWAVSCQGSESYFIREPRPLMNKKLNAQANPVISINEHDVNADWWIDLLPAILEGAHYPITLNIVNQNLVDLLLSGKMVIVTRGDGVNFDIKDEGQIGVEIDKINNGESTWNKATGGAISIGNSQTGNIVDDNGKDTAVKIEDKKEELEKENPATPGNPEPEGVASSDFVTMYIVDSVTLKSLAHKLWSKDFIDSIYKMYADPISAVISLHAVPSKLAYGASYAGIQDIVIGNYATGIPANVVGSQYSSFYVAMNEKVTDDLYPKWLNFEPYSTYQIYLPFVGFQNISSEVAFNVRKVKYTMDYLSGDVSATLMGDKDNALSVYNGNCAISIPVTGDNYGRLYAQAIGAVGGVIANPGSAGNLLQVSGSVLSALDGAGSVNMGGNLTGNKGFLAPGNVFIVRHYTETYGDIKEVQNLSKVGGLIYGQARSLGDEGDGNFVKASAVYLDDIGGTEEEKNEIVSLLMEGVYY